MVKQDVQISQGTHVTYGTRLLLLLMLLLPAFATGAWGAEMVTNGVFNGSTGWTFSTATYDSTTTRTVGSGSARVATVTKAAPISGTVIQAVSIPAGSIINPMSLYSQLVVVGAGSATGNSISVDLHYTTGSTVNILSTGNLTAHTWAGRNGTGLTLAADVDQIIITMNALSGSGGGTQTATLYVDEVSISYTPYSDPLMHNSNNLGAKYWSANNGWGVAGGQYGEFTCATCHNRGSANIKRVVDSIPATIGTAVIKPVKFNNVTAFGNDAGGHTTSQRVCEVCHTQTTVHKYSQTTGDLNHKNANLTDCTSCHAHNKSFGASCNSCHGYPPINATLGTDGLASPATGVLASGAGAHDTHVNLRGMTCETCHQGYTQNPMGNDAIEFGFNINGGTIAGFKGTFNGGSFASKTPNAPYSSTATYAGTTVNMATGNTNTCSNLYCHGGYTGSNGSMMAPSWTDGAAAKACGACHGTSQATPPTSGNHVRHTGTATGQLGIACSDCHGTLPADNAHVNGNVVTKLNASSKLRANATYKGFANQSSAALSYGTCAVYCHSTVQDSTASAVATPTVTPTWGGSAFVSCDTSVCHGNPPANANHTTHVNAGYGCNVCHSAAGQDTAKHADYNIDVTFSGVAGSGTYSQSASNPPGNGFGTCSTTYCHGSAASAPTWGGSPMPSDCTGCHGNEATAATKLSGAHNAHLNNTNQGGAFNCSSCHAPTITNTNNRTITNNALHVNGMVNYSGLYSGKNTSCSTFYCHSNGKGGAPVTAIPAWASGTLLYCNGCHGSTGNTSGMPTPDVVGVNSHVKHLPTQDTTKCVYCHDTTVNGTNAIIGGSSHINNARDVRFSKPSTFTNNSGAYNAGARTCSATYCHGSAASDAWGTAGPLACNKCHDASNALPGAHGIHYNTATVATGLYGAVPGSSSQSTTAYQFACSACHGTDTNAHADMPKTSVSDATIFFGFSSAGRGATANSAYTRPVTGSIDTKTFKWTTGNNGNCTATYCHSNGRGSNGGSTTVNWGITARDTSCGTCHGNATTTIAGTNPATTPTMLSGAHKSHIGNAAGGGSFGCVDCHATTVSSDTAIATNAYGKHVNKFVDYSGAYAGKTRTCSTFYCHTNGNGGAPLVAVPAWSSATTLDCSGCHGSTSANLTTGSHAAHLLMGATCQNCHSATASSNTAIASVANHINRTKGVAQGGTFKAVSVSFGGTTTCSAISCHGGATAPNATWGTTLNCAGCHPNPGSGHTPNVHALHIGSMLSSVNFYNYTANKTTSTEYRFGCANCHPMDEATYHMNGTIDISLNKNTAGIGSLRTKNSVTTDTAGYTQVVNTTVTCSAAYCHSNGVTTPTYATTINWYATSLATDKCQICHGNSPGAAGQIAGSAAHGAHVVGIHYKGIFNGKSGFLPQSATKGGAVNAAHGTDSRATTINCNLCHNDTVTQAANDYNSACVSCHGATIVKNSGDLIANKTFHVNGAINIKLANTKIVSKAQIRPTSFTSYTAATAGNWARNKSFYKNYTSAYDVSRTAMQVTDYNVSTGCSNLSCHNGKTVKWTDTVTCNSCHTRL